MVQKKHEKCIVIDELSTLLYQYHIKNKNYRIARLLRCFILQEDFQDFLQHIKENYIKPNSKKNKVSQKNALPSMSFHDLQRCISAYTKKISQSEYFNKQSRRFQSDFVALADNLIYMSYVVNYENHVSTKKPLRDMTMIHCVDESTVNLPSSEFIWTSDTLINFTNISYDFFYKDYFQDTFDHVFFNEPKKKRWPKHMKNLPQHHPEPTPLQDDDAPEPEKICQILISENAEKHEVLEYIEKHWERITNTLRAQRPAVNEKRVSADKTFLRDIAIYNTYKKVKKSVKKNPENDTRRWLRDESEYKAVMDQDTLRKIVSSLNIDIRSLKIDN